MNISIWLLSFFSLMFGFSAFIVSILFYFKYRNLTALYFGLFILSNFILIFLDYSQYFILPVIGINNFHGGQILYPGFLLFSFSGLSFIYSIFNKKVPLKLWMIFLTINIVIILLTLEGWYNLGFIPIIVCALFMVIFIYINYSSIKDPFLRKSIKIFLLISISIIPLLMFYFISGYTIVGSLGVKSYYLVISIYSIYFGFMFFTKKAHYLSKVRIQRFIDKFSITKREMEIIIEVYNGLSTKEIAELLYISENTVNTHIRNIFTKSDVKSRSKLIKLFSQY